MSAATAAVNKFTKNFAENFGSGAMSKANELPPYEVISTGSLGLDHAMGCGGYIVGRLAEWWGPYGLGKTTMALVGAAEAQKAYPDRMVGFIDVEKTFDSAWAAAHGVDLDRLQVLSPKFAEDVADMTKVMIESDLFSMVILDSIGAMLTKAEAEKNAEDEVVGRAAKLITRMVKIAASQAPTHHVAVVLINQIRSSIGTFVGPDITRPGGHAAQHVTTHVLKPRRTRETPYSIGSGENKIMVGHEIAVTVEKNKVAPPKRTALISMFNTATEKYGPVGIDRVAEAWALSKRLGLIEQSGSWYMLPDETKHQGETAALDHLRTHPEVLTTIRTRALASVAHEVITDPLKEG